MAHASCVCHACVLVLMSAESELNEAFPSVQTRTVRSEATQSEPADLQPVVDAVSSLNVTILVNNVGVATEMPTELAESTADDVKRQVHRHGLGCTPFVLTVCFRSS